MLILGIETSCDETSVALVRDGRQMLVNLIASQTPIHAEYGGVVPELASRAHIQHLVPMIGQCLGAAGITLGEVDAIAVTQGPGLIGALLVGVETAKGLAYVAGKPLIPVHHIAAHLYSPFVAGKSQAHTMTKIQPDGQAKPSKNSAANDNGESERLEFPYLGLVVSGGHTSLIRVDAPDNMTVLEETYDDAAGEAFDKAAKLLGLGYPGGPIMDRLAASGDPKRFDFPRPMTTHGRQGFSFSGLKTALSRTVQETGTTSLAGDAELVADLCASFQEAIVDVLLRKTAAALQSQPELRALAIVGGVACNSRLRAAAQEALTGTPIIFPPPALCTDNAAMIAGLAYHLHHRHPTCDLGLDARASLPLDGDREP